MTLRKSILFITIMLTLSTAGIVFGQVGSPGFETGPDVAEIAFTPTDVDGLLWFASNTDGERIRTEAGRPASEGDFYASLLQNAGAYDGSPLGIGDFGFGGFDRIYALFSVTPDTQYTVCFDHAADDRFGYLGDTTVVEIVDADSNTTLHQATFPTPGFFAWQTETFVFTSGPNTTTAAIAFTVMGSSNTSATIDNLGCDVPVELSEFSVE